MNNIKRRLEALEKVRFSGTNITQAAIRRAKKEKSMCDMALVFRACFSTWEEAARALGLTPGLLYQVAAGTVKDSPAFRKAFGLIPEKDYRHDYRPRLSVSQLHQLTTDDTAWAAWREELKVELERRENHE